MNKIDARDYRLDLLKAIAISLVLFWHLKPLGLTASSAPAAGLGSILNLVPIALGIFYYQVTLIGVPVFIIVSLYLFYGKIDKDNYFRNRILRITQIFIFWTAIQFGIYFLLKFLVSAGDIKDPHNLFPQINFDAIIMGGPDLPVVGGSVLYFLFDLIFLYILAYGYHRLNARIRKPLGWVVIVLSAMYFQFCIFGGTSVAFWNIENFLVYIPIAHFLRFSGRFSKLKKFYLLGFIIFGIEESKIALKMGSLGNAPYDRISIVFGAIALVSFVFESSRLATQRKKHAVISLVSMYSLGIYATHKYWFLLLRLFAGLYYKVFPRQDVLLFNLDLHMARLIIATAAVLLTLLSAYLLGKTPLKRFVS
ncbi:MAG: acyltransferase family protein [Actinomycetota bacterium]|nr:acyltransferase family protein [Actinomycetota bacterium]